MRQTRQTASGSKTQPSKQPEVNNGKQKSKKRAIDDAPTEPTSRQNKQRKKTLASSINDSTGPTSTEEPQVSDSRLLPPRLPSPPNPNSIQKEVDNELENIEKDIEEFENTLTVENYLQYGKAWPMKRVQRVVDARKKFQSQILEAILTEARYNRLVYRKKKMTLAAIAKVKLTTLERALGESSPPRGRDAYRQFMAYGKDSLKLKMPNKGGEVMVLSERNRKAGRIWTTQYTADQRRVFDEKRFFALAGIPNLDRQINIDPDEDEDQNEQGSAPKVETLSPEDEERYRPIYNELVAHDKVLQTEGLTETEVDVNKSSLKRVRQLGKLLAREGERLSFKYIFLASSALPPNKKTGAGWSRKFTSVPAITQWADREIGLLPVFATVAQGESMINAISHIHDKKTKKTRPALSEPQPSNVLKTTLANILFI
ncbi:uncharacterized protein MELLADRAFT_89920 [Melampsora larici-populina 98AG31]|uniref:Uncharacterized protein n=1 Tax=Melampsora larici-populina (strain 98AG31 / pathotype 3-4-7) TaxID=747676 RepID=F4RV41_MELLP|nr:uncharacterized protein MELLADRAFT_89920 [Melampsora larici-populina 98AG31]EGG03818.1 hypothetical protein MELLADRAFT_89920 [Melampsora larici-populina 98AG31]